MCSDRVPLEVLRERVAYDPATGILTWRHCGAHHFTDERSWKSWTAKFAGKPVAKRLRGRVVVAITIDQQEHHAFQQADR